MKEIVLNITMQIPCDFELKWHEWLYQDFLLQREVVNDFVQHKLYRVRTADAEVKTYALQLFAADNKNFETFMDQELSKLLQSIFIKWGDEILAFASILESVN